LTETPPPTERQGDRHGEEKEEAQENQDVEADQTRSVEVCRGYCEEKEKEASQEKSALRDHGSFALRLAQARNGSLIASGSQIEGLPFDA
jgi:hypothetical protein